MTVTLALLTYAVLLCTVGARALRRAQWVTRAPRLAVVAWLTLVASAVVSVVLGGIGVTLSVGRVSGGLAELLRSCATALRHEYGIPGGVVVAAAGGAVAAFLVTRLVSCVAVELLRASWRRRAHRRVLAMVGRRDPALDVLVVEHDIPVAYCLPGRRGEQVVVTTAVLGSLAADEIEAVLAHERAHLRGRHHLVAAVAAGISRVVPFVPAFRVARAEVERLLELRADDAAARSCPRLSVARALLTVGAAGTPVGALGAGGSSTAQRVRRMIDAARPLRSPQRLVAALVAAAVFAFPLLVAAGPAFAVTEFGYCPVDVRHVHGTPHLHTHD